MYTLYTRVANIKVVPSVTLHRVEREIVVVKREVFKFQIELGTSYYDT